MGGQGVLQAVNNINSVIAPQLLGKDPTNQTELDQLLVDLDSTANKSKLGANALIAVSQAIVKVAAVGLGLPLYDYIFQKYQLVPQLAMPSAIYNMIDGGKHGATNLDFQEFQILPASHIDFVTSLEMATVIFHKIEETLIAKGAIHSVGTNGGFAPNLYNNTDAFEIMIEAIKQSPFTFAQDVFFGVDAAAAEFFKGGKYVLKDKAQPYSSQELFEYYKNMRKLYHVFSIEDPFQEDDEKMWQSMTTEIGETTTVIGDDLLVGNKERTTKGINNKWCNAILIKPNQVGTISETIEVVHQAQLAGWQVIVSHRGGETNDDFIADFAVGIGAAYTKFGPPNRGERIAKYNRLLQIDQEIAQRNAAIQTATRAPMETPAPVAAAPIETTLPPATPPESTAPAPAV
jgi:enolase